jgi:DNA-binding GntR family transcriptional regulator
VGRVSTLDALVTSLRRQILEGTIPAGSHLGEVELADAFGVSRQSIRSALAELVHMGLLERAQHRGVSVPRLTRSELTDLWYVRRLIEVEAVRYGIRAGVDWSPLESAVERIAALTAESSWADAVEADLDFHRTLVASAGSPHLARIHELLMGELSLSLSGNVGNEAPGYMSGEHRMLLDTLHRGDPDATTDMLERHLVSGLDLVGRSPSIVES